MRYPIVRATTDNRFELAEDYKIKGVKIPKGFKSDGLTLKNRLLRLIINKYEPKFQPFYFLHDYLCFLEEYELADKLGALVLFDLEKSPRTKIGMSVIRMYHKFRYR